MIWGKEAKRGRVVYVCASKERYDCSIRKSAVAMQGFIVLVFLTCSDEVVT